MEEAMFLGHEISYWQELKRHAEETGIVELIQEIAALRARVSFYEARIGQMVRFREVLEKD